jgi:RNA polymerase subunit RPABC4/transcription elongation factor Spt4
MQPDPQTPTCPTCGHSTEHTHEWEAAGMVEFSHTIHSPVSRLDDAHVNRVYVIQNCKCGSTRHKLVAEK